MPNLDRSPPPPSPARLGATYSVAEIAGTGAAGGGDGGRCGVCEKKVGQKQRGISCDMCERWFHCGCVGLAAADYEFYSGRGSDAVWVCQGCRGNFRGISRRMEKLEKENEELKRENDNIMGKFQVLIDRIEGYKEDIVNRVRGELIESMDVAIDRKIERRFKEEEEKKKRECNVVVHGLKEGNDREVCEGIVRRELELTDISVESVVRLGGNRDGGQALQGRLRPLLVRFRSAGQKWAVIGRAKRLKDGV